MQQIRIDSPIYIEGLSRLAEAIKNYGSVAFIQLFHAGRQTAEVVTQGQAQLLPVLYPVP